MNNELINEIKIFIKNISEISELTTDDSTKTLNIVADKYIINRTNTWWWEELNQKSITIEYDDSDGLLLLKKIVNDENALVKLIVTDDEPEPWPVFQGNFKEIIKTISEQRFFEYFIAANDYSWLIFDTHHNALIVIGSLYEIAQSFINMAD